MRVLLRSYDIDDSGTSGVTLRTIARYLQERGHTVWANGEAQLPDDVRAWSPDLILGQQWATEEASRWATILRVPFVMLVHGPGQYEQFMPQCDLVVFNTHEQLELARAALGSTQTMVLDLREPSAELDALHSQLMRLVQAGRRRPTLSLCMTVANEAATLEQAVESVAPYVDQIIIGVDRKSSDETASIARGLATDYFEYREDSPPDFPRMRNRAMERVQTDWAIVLDGHEWIEHAELIGPALETTAWSIEIQTLFEPDEQRVPGLSFPFPRIHRRHVRFVGAAAHEEISTPYERRDSHLEIKVWHERKPGQAATERSREKMGSELAHLRAAWDERGDRRALFYLANGLREAGRLEEAIAAYELYLQAPNFREEGWQALLYMARCHAERKEWVAARRLFERAIMQCPERAEASVGLAYLLLEMGEARTASAFFRMAASLPEPTHCRLFVEVPVYRWGAWHGLALALDRLGDYEGAIEAEKHARAGGAGPWAARNINYWLNRTAAQSAVELAS
jgi:hypothetical protein